MTKEKAGLYIHIPFCKNKCPYCDFYSVKYCDNAGREYSDRLVETIKQYQGSFDTVYFGGGTPSILDTDSFVKILNACRKQFDIDDESEITVECNPSADLNEKMQAYAALGVNRVSIGMQSAVDRERFALGRAAGRKEVERTISYARNAGINNISLDLMLGTPKQTTDSLDESFRFILEQGVEHLSAYMLKLEPGTKFYEMRNKLVLPDEDETAEMYLKTVEVMNQNGLKQYEISNFAKSGFESRHNTKYWTLTPYLGLGKSAHSFWHGERFYCDSEWNIISDGAGGDDEEKIMLGLRLTRGVEKSLIKKDFSSYIKSGLMRDLGDRVALTPNGMLVSNTIISSLI